MRNYKIYIVFLFAFLPVLLSATLYVDDDYVNPTDPYFNTIQAAIDASNSGETIHVYPGTYNEDDLTANSHSLIIESDYADTGDWKNVENTMINAAGFGCTALTLSGNYDFEINGFTIQKGIRGIYCSNYASLDLLNCIVEDNSNADIGGGILVLTCSSLNIENCIIRNNVSGKGGGIYSSNASVTIYGSEFYGNEATDYDGGAICFSYSAYECRDLTISRSIFYENISEDRGGAIYYPGSYNTTTCELNIDFTTFADNVTNDVSGGKAIDLGSDSHDYAKNVLIENSIIAESSPNITTSTYNCDINYSCLENGCDNPNADLYNCITSDPDFVSAANDDYHIEWGSGCIDTADPAADEDDDYSQADMGVYPYERDHFNLSARYCWICFPRLDVSDEVNNGENDDYVLVDAAMDNYWETLPEDVYIYDEDDPLPPNEACYGEESENDLDWDPETYSFFSFRGIKVCAGEQFYIGGYLMDPTYEFDDLTADQDNWLGYFLEDSQHVEDAIDSGFLDDILEIRTQTWSMIRASTAIEWQIYPSYTFNYGDLVIIKPDVTISDFKWEQPARDITEPVYRPRAEYFTFEEEIDYMSIIAEFSPQDMPQEVAIFVNDVCKGAQVVEDTLCQICAYILEEDPGSEIEFELWDGERSIRKPLYNVLNNVTGEISGTKLVTGSPGSYYYVSFKDDTELPPAIKYNLRVAPNPFNPSTAICFELENESEIKLSIYNVKGQIVKTLVNETYRPGAYQVIWDGDDQSGQKMSSGVYFYRMECGEDVINSKMLMLK
jgi:hypothetical protein